MEDEKFKKTFFFKLIRLYKNVKKQCHNSFYHIFNEINGCDCETESKLKLRTDFRLKRFKAFYYYLRVLYNYGITESNTL